jgi:hypothetical protein
MDQAVGLGQEKVQVLHPGEEKYVTHTQFEETSAYTLN